MNIIWVSAGSKTNLQNLHESGSISAPFTNLKQAMNKITNSSKVFWTIYVSPGFYPDPFTIPSEKIICIVGASRITMLGEATWKIAGKLSSIVVFRDIGIDKLIIQDDLIKPISQEAAIGLENTSVNEITKTAKGKVDIGIASISAASEKFAATLGGAGVVYGDINTDSYILANNVGFTGGKIIVCHSAKLQDCLIEQDILISGSEITLKGTQWLNKHFKIEFINSPGKLLLDNTSHNSYLQNKIELINGEVEEF